MLTSLAAHLRRNRSLYAWFSISAVLVMVATVLWVRHPSNTTDFGVRLASPSVSDGVQALYDRQIDQNLRDFNRWYKANIVIQALTIIVGIFSTVFASLATQEDAKLLRRAVVALTAITTALVAIQATFHVKDNLDTFIKANSDLQVSKFDYIRQRDGAASPNDRGKTAELKLQVETLNSLVRVIESRMRAYSAIGAQQARGASADVVREVPSTAFIGGITASPAPETQAAPLALATPDRAASSPP